MGNWKLCITTHSIRIIKKTIHIFLLKQTNVSSLRVNLFVACIPPDPDTLLFSDFNSSELPHMKCCLFGLSYDWVLYFVFVGNVVFLCLQYEAHF